MDTSRHTSPYLQRPLRSLEAYQRELAARHGARRPIFVDRPEQPVPRPERVVEEKP